MRNLGVVARGLRTPIIKKGDNLLEIMVDTLDRVHREDNIEFRDMDVIAITESILARAQGNYATIDQIKSDFNRKFKEEIGVVFPITSRNRFSIIMKAIAETDKKIKIFFNFPSDEVGNALFDKSLLIGKDINIYNDILNEEEFRNLVGEKNYHIFTGIDYVDLYKGFRENKDIEVYFTNNPEQIAKLSKEILICNIHDRLYYKNIFRELGLETVLSLDDMLNESVDGSGYNELYGLYGSNLSSEDSIKLFPRDSQEFVEKLQDELIKKYNVNFQVMIYGDGAFKDPVGKIWELADPVVSPGFTKDLQGTPNELKIKYIADTDLKDLNADEALVTLKDKISKKDKNLVGQNASLGTTPRQITDLLGSLSDLVSGSGDKGTPAVLIQGYFDNLASN
ncbi:coenzyme F420-0:L-glutamate ligase [Lagierella sp.]|uniref:coenzyme F420-0:L-glutamate ligase n=1 Tax=Lagierella sp. TaxID=2849657 RepID=UPI0026105BD8|nr:coenzyme F420-0:L-glutamate ligase [Lagierella sp.]